MVETGRPRRPQNLKRLTHLAVDGESIVSVRDKENPPGFVGSNQFGAEFPVKLLPMLLVTQCAQGNRCKQQIPTQAVTEPLDG